MGWQASEPDPGAELPGSGPRSAAAGPRTIVGIASGTPDGGVAVVRLSGPEAFEIGRRVAGTLPPPREARVRQVRLGPSKEQALVIAMPSPGSFTGEDVVELHVHGGRHNVGEVVETLLRAGAVAAGPGEFTRRAFAHGRLGLDQAEGIAALVAAQSRAAVDQARRLVAGELGAAIREQERRLAQVRVEVEAALDFPDEVDVDPRRWGAVVSEVDAELERWLGGFERGRRARERPRVVLAGAPNAGKSALFNALVGQARAIVADLPGTTRDFVEAEVSVGRHAIVVIDTAGMREAVDVIERAGVERARDQVAGADLVVWVCDGSGSRADWEMPSAIGGLAEADDTGGGRRVTVWTKSDRWERAGATRSSGDLVVSARTGEGVDALREWIGRWVVGSEAPWIGLARHRGRVDDARGALTSALELLGGGELQEELVAFHLGVAMQRLGEVDGRSSLGPEGAEVLDAIFSGFCIGK